VWLERLAVHIVSSRVISPLEYRIFPSLLDSCLIPAEIFENPLLFLEHERNAASSLNKRPKCISKRLRLVIIVGHLMPPMMRFMHAVVCIGNGAQVTASCELFTQRLWLDVPLSSFHVNQPSLSGPTLDFSRRWKRERRQERTL
jgi:hypothetical protein